MDAEEEEEDDDDNVTGRDFPLQICCPETWEVGMNSTMYSFCSLCFYRVIVVAFVVTTTVYCGASNEDRKIHIVYMGSLSDGEYSPSSQHNSILQEVLESGSVSDALVRSYKRSFNGFAAKLTDKERQKLAGRSEVVSVFPSRTLQLQTTRSWDFMGFSETIKRIPSVESDLIVGVIDTGIWPDSQSFSGFAFRPPPRKWKGVCAGGKNFTCNNKLIGARFYPISDDSALDIIGHGTHTASTAAGNSVENASFYGVAQGTARGGVPSSRIAMYKVCDDMGCQESDILAAFDDAIADGVDIITVSLGSRAANELTEDSVAIGSFHAMAKNILTVQSAGNNGFARSTVASIAPWLFTVAASNTDRRIVDKVVLANGKEFVGNVINSFSLNGTSFPIILGQNASNKCSPLAAEFCAPGCLDSNLVKGKILVCRDSQGINEALSLGALGTIFQNARNNDFSTILPFPASSISKSDFDTFRAYVNSSKFPQGSILKSEGLKVNSAPQVASFSSRGPNRIIPDILKPDISAPGVDILAAYSIVAPLSESFPQDTRKAKYSVLSGTSMSCPHTAGAAAYVKSLHPDWSPSAIKSALMTTAWPMNSTVQSDFEFAYGAGHINPVKAADPGLVYEITKDGYIKMLCGIGFNQTTLRLLSGDNNSTCPKDRTGSSPKDLNYPSMAAFLNTSNAFEIKFTRTVTNVGSPNSVYKSNVTANNLAVRINVVPNILSFKSIGEKKDFVVTVSGKNGLRSMLSASLVWSDRFHNVRSPIVVYTN